MRRAGFTLVELLVAISILAIVAVLGWRGLDGIVRARLALGEQMETTRGMQLAFAQMQSDCERLADPATLHNRPQMAFDSDRLTLVRYAFVENEPARLVVVSYRVQDKILLRRESVGTRDLVQLDVLWKAAISDADSTAPVQLQAGVTAMALRVWEGGGWRTIMPPPVPAVPGQPQAGPTGLEIALRAHGMQTPMTKVYLLGGL